MTSLIVKWNIALLVFAIMAQVAHAQGARDYVILATTTSVRDSRLLERLLPEFEREMGVDVRVLAVGSGRAMALGRLGEADILILHDPSGEEVFVAEGFGVEREPLMHNEFVIVGPPEDAARIRGRENAEEALRSIAAEEALFVSRGDASGTHVAETALWGRAGLTPQKGWYRESGQGMGATLQIASELAGYALSDIGTFLKHKAPLRLEILVAGDSALFNPYHIIIANPARFEWANTNGARALSSFLRSPSAQARIGAFGREEFGRPLFVPDAVPQGRE